MLKISCRQQYEKITISACKQSCLQGIFCYSWTVTIFLESLQYCENACTIQRNHIKWYQDVHQGQKVWNPMQACLQGDFWTWDPPIRDRISKQLSDIKCVIHKRKFTWKTDQQDEAENRPEGRKEAAGRQWSQDFCSLQQLAAGQDFYMGNICGRVQRWQINGMFSRSKESRWLCF